MAGQCAYQQKHYPKAIKFYKQSVAIKNQIKYTPTLLWNMAQAYKALKDGKNYQPRRKAPSFSYGDIRLVPAGLC